MLPGNVILTSREIAVMEYCLAAVHVASTAFRNRVQANKSLPSRPWAVFSAKYLHATEPRDIIDLIWSYIAFTPELTEIAFARQHMLCAGHIDRHPELSRNPRQRVAISRIPEPEFRNSPRLPLSAIGIGTTSASGLDRRLMTRRLLVPDQTVYLHWPNSLQIPDQRNWLERKARSGRDAGSGAAVEKSPGCTGKVSRALRVLLPQAVLRAQRKNCTA